ncbi:MAG: type II secretion system protein, partial [Nitrospirota bacterium]
MTIREAGFTLIELLITMVVFVLTILAATAIFVPLLAQFKQQSKIAESALEETAGLEMLRRDIEHAGYGIPWSIQGGVAYSEALSSPADNYNETTVDGTTDPPRAIQSGNNVFYPRIVKGSDYLVIRATSVATNDAASKWTEVKRTPNGGTFVKKWNATAADLKQNDRVIVLITSR